VAEASLVPHGDPPLRSTTGVTDADIHHARRAHPPVTAGTFGARQWRDAGTGAANEGLPYLSLEPSDKADEQRHHRGGEPDEHRSRSSRIEQQVGVRRHQPA